ncbi:MAG: invasion associated locus B family protein [Silicimonas sp.]|nr:invasion associated locus B family protein [Silicimonas sp.]
MSKIVGFLGASAVLAFTSLAFAQDSSEQDQTPPADGNSAAGLSTGTPVETGPQVGDTYVAEKIQDWELRCIRADGGKDPCQLYQLLKDAEGNSVAEFSLFNLPEGGEALAGATIITPLETLLTAQLRLGVDGGQGKRYPYSFCSNVGCFARVGFTAEDIDRFKKGSSAQVVIVPAAAPQDTVDLSVSLSGFTAGWNAVIAANAPE